VRRLRRLLAKRSARWDERVCVLEGPDLVVAALEADASVEAVYFDHRAETPERVACAEALALAARHGVRLIELAAGVLDRVADAVTPQPVLAVAAMPPTGLDVVPAEGFILVLCEVRDPGNLGTAIRAADASGAAGVIVAGESVDVFNPKTLRATAGSVYHLPVAVVATLDEAVVTLRGSSRRLLGSVVRDGTPHWDARLDATTAIVIGGEAAGLNAHELALLDGTVSIEMSGRAESLNAGVAAALLCFEARRHSSLGSSGPTI
jgi:RNA methyltransferase, TrmH family